MVHGHVLQILARAVDQVVDVAFLLVELLLLAVGQRQFTAGLVFLGLGEVEILELFGELIAEFPEFALGLQQILADRVVLGPWAGQRREETWRLVAVGAAGRFQHGGGVGGPTQVTRIKRMMMPMTFVTTSRNESKLKAILLI